MPQAVGALPAGTLLYAASVGADAPGAFMEQPLYRSDDAGVSFSRIDGATCGRSPVPRVGEGSGSGSGSRSFSSPWMARSPASTPTETDAGHSQVLKLTATVEGVPWTAPRVIVSGPAGTDRQGMATVRRLPSGRYAMSFEKCSTVALDCSGWLAQDR